MTHALQSAERLASLPRLDATIRPIATVDGHQLAEFSRKLPEHDLLFLDSDLRDLAAAEACAAKFTDGTLVGVAADVSGELAGMAGVMRDPHEWSSHVGEIRALVLSKVRGKGLGGALLLEAVRIALKLGVTKMIARMTPDQTAAIALFMGMGFRGEAMLKNHVKDGRGRLFDLTILSHEVGADGAGRSAIGR